MESLKSITKDRQPVAHKGLHLKLAAYGTVDDYQLKPLHVPKSIASTTTNPADGRGKKSLSNASIRGSKVENDFAALTETVFGVESMPVSNATSLATFHKKAVDPLKQAKNIEKIKAELDKVGENTVDEWLHLDKASANPNYIPTKKHFLRIINTLNYDEKIIEVSNYQTVNDLADVYAIYNIKCRQYIWKDIRGKPLQMHRTLQENKLIDKSDIIDEIGLDYFPTILLYFRDGFEHEKMDLNISVKDIPIDIALLAPPRNY